MSFISLLIFFFRFKLQKIIEFPVFVSTVNLHLKDKEEKSGLIFS